MDSDQTPLHHLKMDTAQNDLERLLLSEHARRTAEDNYANNLHDADLEEALVISPTKHDDAQWCLGNAHTSHAFLTPDHDMARICFERAYQCFQKAVDENPGNELYIKSLEATAKAPELHMELPKHRVGQQALGGGSSATSNAKSSAKKKSSDLKYDIFGCIILAVALVAWVGMAKSHVPPPPPR